MDQNKENRLKIRKAILKALYAKYMDQECGTGMSEDEIAAALGMRKTEVRPHIDVLKGKGFIVQETLIEMDITPDGIEAVENGTYPTPKGSDLSQSVTITGNNYGSFMQTRDIHFDVSAFFEQVIKQIQDDTTSDPQIKKTIIQHIKDFLNHPAAKYPVFVEAVKHTLKNYL